MKPTKLFPTFLILGLTILLIGFNVNCKEEMEIDNPYNPISDNPGNGNGNNPLPEIAEGVFDVQQGTLITLTTRYWEISLNSVKTITEPIYCSNWPLPFTPKEGYKWLIPELKAKNAQPEKEDFPPFRILGDKMFTIEADNISYMANKTQVGAANFYCFPDLYSGTRTLDPGKTVPSEGFFVIVFEVPINAQNVILQYCNDAQKPITIIKFCLTNL